MPSAYGSSVLITVLKSLISLNLPMGKNSHSTHLLEFTHLVKIAKLEYKSSIRTLPCHNTPVTIKLVTRAELFLMRLLYCLT